MAKTKKTDITAPVPRHGEVVRPPQDRNDGWQNFVTLMGTSADKRTQSHLTWDLRPPEFYEQLYAGGGIPARIVDVVPEHALRRWVDWTNVKNYAKEEIIERSLELDIRGKFLNTWKWGRSYGGACLHIVTDTTDPASPLQKGEKVLALRDLSRWDLRILTTDIEYDFGSPNFGHPRIYYLNVQMGSQYKGYPIHWTRMIRFDGSLVPRRTFIRNNYWHDSILNKPYNAIRNYEMAHDTAASALQDFNVDVYKLKNVAAMIGAGRESVLKSRIEMMAFTKSVINAMILDADTEEYDNKSRSLEGVAELLDKATNRLVAETDIPHTILLGESPDGSNATGNSTSQAWYNYLSAEQEHYAQPKLNRLIDIIFPEKTNMRPKFKALRVLDDIETANLRKTVAETDQIYDSIGVLDPSEITESRFGGEDFSMDTKIDKAARASGEISPGSSDIDEDPDDDGGPGNGSKEPGPSDNTEVNNKTKGKKNSDMTGRGKADSAPTQEPAETAMEAGHGESEFGLRNTELKVPNGKPAVQSFIGQTESLPMRDPRTDPPMKGPGIPNKARTFLPTRGTGVVAQSGFDFQKDAGQRGSAQDIGHVEPNRVEDSASSRAATIIVKKGDQFLMGKRRDNGRWTLPGGHVDDLESHHQGAMRELMEETGLQAKRLKFLGSRLVEPKQGHSVHINMYEHKADEDAKPTWKIDPDKEINEFRWLSSKEPLPEEISGNLQHPNNVALVHLGLLK